ncbi:nucleoside triphosphate pyrophosphohydrolase [Sesbania bispinosa]|nr:nucleoside triphosphate pyrophosphohydrolase [Sesbania bispinosa]
MVEVSTILFINEGGCSWNLKDNFKEEPIMKKIKRMTYMAQNNFEIVVAIASHLLCAFLSQL